MWGGEATAYEEKNGVGKPLATECSEWRGLMGEEGKKILWSLYNI